MLTYKDLSQPVILSRATYDALLDAIDCVRARAEVATPGMQCLYDAVADGLGAELRPCFAYGAPVQAGAGAAPLRACH